MAPENTTLDVLAAGACAAFMVDLLIYPLDTIKTRLQSPQYTQLYVDAATGTIHRSFYRGLYQGMGSVILATVPSSGAFFTTYEGTKSLLARQATLPVPVVNSAASAVGELVSCLILTPAEVLKQNAQMVTRTGGPSKVGSKLFDANATMIAFRKFNNARQLWRGYTALAGRNLPFTAMHFPMFEHFRAAILDHRKSNGSFTDSMLERGVVTAISAASAGCIAAVLTTPVDVVKTRIMLSAANDGTLEKADKTSTSARNGDHRGIGACPELKATADAARRGRAGGFAVGREILRSEGVKALFRGGALRGIWTAVGSALYLSVYESGRRYLAQRRTFNDD